jgi:hypothetical protein
VLDVVELGEQAAGVGRMEAMELVAGLPAEVRAIHEKENPASAPVLDEAVGESAGGVGLACSRGHVDQGSRAVFSERGFKAGDGLDLAVAHAMGGKGMRGRHRLQSAAEGVGLTRPSGKGFRAVEGEDLARARVGIALIAELRFDAGGFVMEGQRAIKTRRQEIRHGAGVADRLIGDAGEGCSFLFGLDDADGFAVDQQQVVARAGFEGDLAQRDTATSREVHLLEVLHRPATRHELGIYLLPGTLFRGEVEHAALPRILIHPGNFLWTCA